MKTRLIYIIITALLLVSTQSCRTITNLQKKTRTTKSVAKKIQEVELRTTYSPPKTETYSIPILSPRYMTKDTTIFIYDPKYKHKPSQTPKAKVYYKNGTPTKFDCIQDSIMVQSIINRTILEATKTSTNTKQSEKIKTPPNLIEKVFEWSSILKILFIILVVMIVKRFFNQ